MTVKATKAAMKLAGMYYLNLDDVPFLGAKVTVEDVKKHLEESKGLNPEENDAHKFRRGKPGGYVDYLSKEDIEFVRDNFDFGKGLEQHTDYYKGVFNKFLETGK